MKSTKKCKPKKNTTTSDVSNKNSRSRAELEKAIRAQVAAEEKAHKIVEQLVLDEAVTEDYLTVSLPSLLFSLVNPVPPSSRATLSFSWLSMNIYLLTIIKFITLSHYTDVTIERSILEVCGYPLCSSKLSQVTRQQYKISTKTNRVYDITERKRFCCNFCFKASKYLESQIPTSPVWTRDTDRLEIKLLKKGDDYKSHRLGAGEVLVGVEETPLDVENERGCKGSSETELLQRKLDDGRQCNETTETREEKKLLGELNEKQNHTSVYPLLPETADIIHTSKAASALDNSTNLPCTERMGVVDRDVDVRYPPEITDTTDAATTANVQGNRSDLQNVEFIGNVNRDTVSCQHNRKRGKRLEQSTFESHTTEKVFDDNNHDTDLSQQSISPRELLVKSLIVLLGQWSTLSTLKYLHLVRTPNHRNQDSHIEQKQDSVEEQLENSVGSEMEDFTEKMRQFFSRCGDDSEDEEEEKDESPVAKKETESEIVVKERNYSEESAFVIPLIDSKSQMTIRRRIVFRKLAQILPGMLQEIRLTMAEISCDLTELVHTFSPSSRNVVLRPPQWNVLAVTLVYMLKNHNANVENALKHCKDNFLGLLSRLGVTRHDLDRIITEVYQAEVTAPAPELSGEVKEEMPPSNALTNYGEMEELD